MIARRVDSPRMRYAVRASLPLASGKEVEKIKNPFFTHSVEKVVERGDDRMSQRGNTT